ncbi:unnamed protein product [Durusdinium trenchii]|uniref:Uncharacterized protein n=1 Tax=Durusdinium trenchii TaxID=1381693 RepID=A0ABP0QTG9_9DINO
MLEHLPVTVISLVQSDTYTGGDLILLDSAVARPSAEELANNYCWLKPIVMDSPSKVPSGYYLTDAFLRLDAKLNRKLFRPKQGECRMFLAGREGVKAKRCVGAIRYLWRNSHGAHDARVLDLKQCLSPSPPRGVEARSKNMLRLAWLKV